MTVILNGILRRQLRDALLNAFPTVSALRQLVSLELNLSLEAISGGTNLTDIVFDLIVWAEARSRVEDLAAAARRDNSTNVALAALAAALGLEAPPIAVVNLPQVAWARLTELMGLLQRNRRELRNNPSGELDILEAGLRETTISLRDLRGLASTETISLDVDAIVEDLDAALTALYRAWHLAESPAYELQAQFYDEMIKCEQSLDRALRRFPRNLP